MIKHLESIGVLVVLVVAGIATYNSLEGRVGDLEGDRLLPKGTVLAYVGEEGASAMPNGWVPCGSVKGTPQMDGRFLVGTANVEQAGESVGEVGHEVGTYTTGYEYQGKKMVEPEGADNYTGDPNWNHQHQVTLPVTRVMFFCKE